MIPASSQNPERAADRRADRLSFAIVLAFSLLSYFVLSSTKQSEQARANADAVLLNPWLVEATSHIAMLIAIAAIPLLLSRFPISLQNWRSRLPTYAVGFVTFSAIHIVGMHILRAMTYEPLLSMRYDQRLLDASFWFYEMRKDLYTFVLIVGLFLASRQIEQLRLENRSMREDARQTGRVTLKSGGRRIVLDSSDILSASAASNYAEIATASGQHLARTTLSALEALLREAGGDHMRIHRSHLVSRRAVREVIPSGNGDAEVVLSNAHRLPVSRRYRQALEHAIA